MPSCETIRNARDRRLGEAMTLGTIPPRNTVLNNHAIGPPLAMRANWPKIRSVNRRRNLPTGCRSAS